VPSPKFFLVIVLIGVPDCERSLHLSPFAVSIRQAFFRFRIAAAVTLRELHPQIGQGNVAVLLHQPGLAYPSIPAAFIAAQSI
jgi:hypothetical protein